MLIPADLKQFGLVQASLPKRRRLVMTSEGGPGSGKSSFFIRSAPRPLLFINIDQNAEGLENLMDDDVIIKKVDVPPFMRYSAKEKQDIQMAEDRKLFTEVQALYKTSVEKNYFRSIMIDEGKALYDLCRRAYHGALDFGEIPQSLFSVTNTAMSRFFTLAKQHRFNLHIPHRLTKERKDGISGSGKKTSTETGRLVRAGWKDAEYDSQCHVRFDKNLIDPNQKFMMTVMKCTANEAIEGFVFVNDEITFPELGRAVFPHSDESDWE